MFMQEYEVTIDRKRTNFKELSDLIDQVGGYPVVAKDYDGTKIAINWEEVGDDETASVWEPGTDERGTKITNYHKDGSVEVTYSNE